MRSLWKRLCFFLNTWFGTKCPRCGHKTDWDWLRHTGVCESCARQDAYPSW